MSSFFAATGRRVPEPLRSASPKSQHGNDLHQQMNVEDSGDYAALWTTSSAPRIMIPATALTAVVQSV